ncbi:hypothetical protein JYT21_00530 [bacterium AH-315-B15]|nr:hypothetical protein [bacterium AH-315-B15]
MKVAIRILCLILFTSCGNSYGQDSNKVAKIAGKWAYEWTVGAVVGSCIRQAYQIDQKTITPLPGYRFGVEVYLQKETPFYLSIGIEHQNKGFRHLEIYNINGGSYFDNVELDSFDVLSRDLDVMIPVNFNYRLRVKKFDLHFGLSLFAGVQIVNHSIRTDLYDANTGQPTVENLSNFWPAMFYGASTKSKLEFKPNSKVSFMMILAYTQDIFSFRRGYQYKKVKLNKKTSGLSFSIGLKYNFEIENVFKNPLASEKARSRKNAVYVELLTYRSLYSLNYESTLVKHDFVNLYLRVGCAYNAYKLNTTSSKKTLYFPLGLGVALGKTVHKCDIGIGLAPNLEQTIQPGGGTVGPSTKNTMRSNVFYPSIGYRLETNRGLLFKTAFNTLFIFDKVWNNVELDKIRPNITFSIGKRF